MDESQRERDVREQVDGAPAGQYRPQCSAGGGRYQRYQGQKDEGYREGAIAGRPPSHEELHPTELNEGIEPRRCKVQGHRQDGGYPQGSVQCVEPGGQASNGEACRSTGAQEYRPVADKKATNPAARATTHGRESITRGSNIPCDHS